MDAARHETLTLKFLIRETNRKYYPDELQSSRDSCEGDWLDLHNQSNDDLVIAHNWFRSLAGIADSTGFDTKRILNEYEIARSTIINEEQTVYVEALNMILDRFNIDASTLMFINKPPINVTSLLSVINIDRVVKVGEVRAAMGLTVDQDDAVMDEYVEPRRSDEPTEIPEEQ